MKRLILSWLLSFFFFLGTLEAESLYHKHKVFLLAGAFTQSVEGIRNSGFGTLEAGYNYSFKPKWSATIDVNNIFKGTNLGSAAWGLDFGANYCFFGCHTEIEKINKDALISESPKWGLSAGAGGSLRIFELTSRTTQVSGYFAQLDAFYYYKLPYQIMVRAKAQALESKIQDLSNLSIFVGMAMSFSFEDF